MLTNNNTNIIFNPDDTPGGKFRDLIIKVIISILFPSGGKI